MTAEIRQQYEDEVRRAIQECRALGYVPRLFMQMVGELGAIEASRRLLAPPVDHCSDGFVRLWELGRLDLTVENLTCQDERFAALFTEAERRIGRERLEIVRLSRCPLTARNNADILNVVQGRGRNRPWA